MKNVNFLWTISFLLQVKKNDDEWASKMSAEFDDIDMYELTVEG